MSRHSAAFFSVVLVVQTLLGCARSLPNRALLSDDVQFNYQKAGSDWAETFPACGGAQQSPINIKTTEAEDQTSFRDQTARMEAFGEGHNVKVANTGQSVRVSWEGTEGTSVFLPVTDGVIHGAIDPLDPNHDGVVDVLKIINQQNFSYANVHLKEIRFHISSENAIDGVIYPMEAHLVGKVPKEEISDCGDEGCSVTFSVLFKLSKDDNEILEPLFTATPEVAGNEFEEELPGYFVLNFDKMVPKTRTYYTWQGSLTTPPCTENILWILFDTMSTVSSRQVALLQSKMAAARNSCLTRGEQVGDMNLMKECKFIGDLKNNRELQPLNGRPVYHAAFLPVTRIERTAVDPADALSDATLSVVVT